MRLTKQTFPSTLKNGYFIVFENGITEKVTKFGDGYNLLNTKTFEYVYEDPKTLQNLTRCVEERTVFQKITSISMKRAM